MAEIIKQVNIIGAGLAGSEAAYQLARRRVPVRLYEMRPGKLTPAHKGGGFAELVCSNSLRAAQITNAVGLLKEEMRQLDSLVMQAADATSVPAGAALAVDREQFSAYIEQELRNHPLVTVCEEEVTAIPEGLTIIAAGPLASPALSEVIADLCGEEHLFFHDAIAPIIDAASIDMNTAFYASRYGKGDGYDYRNCPMNKEQYQQFYQQLVTAEVTPLHHFEQEKHFAGCMPIESMARYGEDAIRFGPMKPVGLELPGGGEAYAVVQLRKENKQGSAYNMVGFQTETPPGGAAQGLPYDTAGLKNRRNSSVMVQCHRNTYINAPKLLDSSMRLHGHPNILFAGQISGVEGYVESASSGLMTGIFAAALARDIEPPSFPDTTAHGALLRFLQAGCGNFQPRNINFGLFVPLSEKTKLEEKG